MMEQKAAPPAAQPAASGSSSSSSGPSGSPQAGVALTLKQQAVYDMKVAGKTRAEIAHILGISQPVVSKTLQACYKKLGLKKRDRPEPNRGAEHTNPEFAAAVLDAGTEPLQKIRDACEAAGLPPVASMALLRRMRIKFAGLTQELRALKTNEILDLLDKKIHLGLHYLDDVAFAGASGRDIMLGLGVMIEKRQLLRGEPTQIISDHERKKLHELMPALIAEAQRRGAVTVDGKTGEILEPR